MFFTMSINLTPNILFPPIHNSNYINDHPLHKDYYQNVPPNIEIDKFAELAQKIRKKIIIRDLISTPMFFTNELTIWNKNEVRNLFLRAAKLTQNRRVPMGDEWSLIGSQIHKHKNVKKIFFNHWRNKIEENPESKELAQIANHTLNKERINVDRAKSQFEFLKFNSHGVNEHLFLDETSSLPAKKTIPRYMGPWKPYEDKILLNEVKKQWLSDKIDWKVIEKALNTRTADACRQHYSALIKLT